MRYLFVMVVIAIVHRGDFPQYVRRISHDNRIFLHIARNHTAGSDYGIIANGYSRKDDGSRPQPDIPTDTDGFVVLDFGGP